MDTNPVFCCGCGQFQLPDEHWRQLWINEFGEMVVSPPFFPRERHRAPGVVMVCGQGSALVLFERYLQSGNFEPAQAHIPQPQPVSEGDAAR